MALVGARREDNALKNDNSLSGRDEVLARYRQLREISTRHHHEILKFISDERFCIRHADWVWHRARR
jgi:hypothetical protein